MPGAENYHSVSHNFSAHAGDFCGTRKIFCYSPHDGTENSASVQRKTRKHVKKSQRRVRLPQPHRKGPGHLRVGKKLRQAVKAESQKKAGKRPGNRDVEFLN